MGIGIRVRAREMAFSLLVLLLLGLILPMTEARSIAPEKDASVFKSAKCSVRLLRRTSKSTGCLPEGVLPNERSARSGRFYCTDNATVYTTGMCAGLFSCGNGGTALCKNGPCACNVPCHLNPFTIDEHKASGFPCPPAAPVMPFPPPLPPTPPQPPPLEFPSSEGHKHPVKGGSQPATRSPSIVSNPSAASSPSDHSATYPSPAQGSPSAVHAHAVAHPPSPVHAHAHDKPSAKPSLSPPRVEAKAGHYGYPLSWLSEAWDSLFRG